MNKRSLFLLLIGAHMIVCSLVSVHAHAGACAYTQDQVPEKVFSVCNESDGQDLHPPKNLKDHPKRESLPQAVVYFAHDQSHIHPFFLHILDAVAASFLNKPKMNLVVRGFADPSGSCAYNQRLSAQRAHHVACYLRDQGIAPSRIMVTGYGEGTWPKGEKPPMPAALMRRVEVAPGQHAPGIQEMPSSHLFEQGTTGEP